VNGYSLPASARDEAGARLSRVAVTLGLGLLAALLATQLGAGSPKYMLVGVAGALFLVAAPLLGSAGRLADVLLAGTILSICFHADKNFLYRAHVGGASALTVSVTDLAIAALIVTRIAQALRGSFELRLQLWWLAAPAFYGVCGFLSLVNAGHPELVVFEELRLLKLLILFVMFLSLRGLAELRTVLGVLSVAVVIEGALAAAQFLLDSNLGLSIFGEQAIIQQDIGYAVSRAGGTLGHPNILAYFFEMLCPLMLALAWVERSRWLRAWYLFTLALGLLGLVMTLSRGAWVAVPLSLGFVVVVLGSRQLLKLRTVAMFFAAAVVVAGIVAPMAPTIQRRLTHDDYRSAAIRYPLDKAAWSIVRQYPIVGVGLNNFSEVFKQHDTTGHSRIFRGYKQVVHNLYLLVWAEVGTLGLLAFLGIFAVPFWSALSGLSRAPPLCRGVLAGGVAGLGAHLVHGFVDPGFKSQMNISVLVFALLGILGAASRLAREEGSHRCETVSPAEALAGGGKAPAQPERSRFREPEDSGAERALPTGARS
jgi:O-antigen ligase